MRTKHIPRQQSHSFCQLLRKVATVTRKRWLTAPIHPAFEAHFAKHHFRTGSEVFVDRDGLAFGIDYLPDGSPGRATREFSRQPLSEDDNVGGYLGVGVSLESVIWKSNCPQEIGLLRHILPERPVHLVECSLGRNEKNQSTGAHLFQRSSKKVVVNDEAPGFEARIERLVVTK